MKHIQIIQVISLGRLARIALLLVVVFQMVFGQALVAKAQAPPAGPAGPTLSDQEVVQLKNSYRNWSNVDSVQDARKFFGSSGGGDKILFRNLVDGEGLKATQQAEQDFSDGKKFRIRVFRNQVPLTRQQYENPKYYDHRTLTLAGGWYLTDSEIRKFISEQTKFSTAGCIAGLPLGGPLGCAGVNGGLNFAKGAVGGVVDAFEQDSEDKAVWAFTAAGNPNVEVALTCQPGGGGNAHPTQGHFVFLPEKSNKALKENTDIKTFEEENQIGNIVTFDGNKFTTTSMAKFLCDKAANKESFEKFCKPLFGADSCPTDSKSLLGALLGFLNPFELAVNLLRKIVGAFVTVATEALQFVLNVKKLTDIDGVRTSWLVMRDLVNVLFILVLIAIAFSTILRIDLQKYSARALLPRLIFAVIGVNFSLLFVTIIVNFSTIISQPFLSGADVLSEKNPAANMDDFLQGIGSLGEKVIYLIAAVVIGIVLLVLTLFFIVRLLMIWILAVLSPFAFLFSVLPFSRSLTTMWLKQLLKWVFMAPIAIIILWIAGNFLASTESFNNTILSVLVFIGMVIAAVLIPLKLGGEVMQRASTGAGKIAGGTRAGRFARSFAAQRREAQEGEAGLAAARARGRISRGHPGRLGTFLTGARPGQVGAQEAGIQSQFDQNVERMNPSSGELENMAAGDTAKLEEPKYRDLADSREGRIAAGRALAKKGQLHHGFLYGDETHPGLSPERLAEQLEAGNHTLMAPFDPVLAAQTSQGNWDATAVGKVKSAIGYMEPTQSKNVLWTDVRKSAHSANEKEQAAGQAGFKAVTPAQAAANIDFGNTRTLISNEGERADFIKGVKAHGTEEAKKAIKVQEVENAKIGVPGANRQPNGGPSASKASGGRGPRGSSGGKSPGGVDLPGPPGTGPGSAPHRPKR